MDKRKSGLKEIRIYFECLEQAHHYVKPNLERVLEDIGFKKLPPIKLVKLKKRYELYATRIKKILEWKDPDILVSLITLDEDSKETEIPLFMIEFSIAVFTEDHELQRFDGMVAAAENNVVFIKISPSSKISEAEHGGKTDFDYRIPFALIYRRYGIIPFHIEWNSNGSIVEVDEEFLSCPREPADFEKVLEIIFRSLNIGEGKVDFNSLIEYTKKLQRDWLNDLEKVSTKTLFNKLSTSRLQINRNTIEVKINRFGHAMDPERGMLVFYSIFFNGNAFSKMVFDKDNDAWYKDIPKEEHIRQIIEKNKLQKSEDFLQIFYLGSGLYKIISFEEFKQYIVEQKDIIKLDLSNLIKEFWNKLSKPLKTIFKFSKQFSIEDKNGQQRVIFNWGEDIIFKNDNVENAKGITPLRKITEIDEDIVTYVTIHNVLKPQGYKILAASYPGAQGDRVVLIASGSGRRQPRRYIDVIAFSLIKNISTLQSNKGEFSQKAINKEIKELRNYKFNNKYKNALKSFWERFEPNAMNSITKIGVGFWLRRRYESNILRTLDLEDLDYFLFITKDMKKWRVARIGNNVNLLDNYEGEISIPTIWEPTEKETISLYSFNDKE